MKEVYDLVILIGFFNVLSVFFASMILEKRIDTLRDEIRNEIRNLKDKE
jgi:hypothetical protein